MRRRPSLGTLCTRVALSALVVAAYACSRPQAAQQTHDPGAADQLESGSGKDAAGAPPPTGSTTEAGSTDSPAASTESTVAHPAEDSTAPTEPPKEKPPELPPGILFGLTTELDVPGDRSVRVVHAGPEQDRALVYLHGMCGNPRAMDDWSPLASHYGTLIVLKADIPCEGRPGFRWPKDVSLIQKRIDAALDVVKQARGGELDTDQLVLVGYSQGAHRGERLAGEYPARYPRLVLGGPPGTAEPERLARAKAVAILGGEEENTDHMRAGDEALRAAGIRSRFFLLPHAHHGQYGPRGPQVMAEVFAWLFAQ